MGRMKSRAISSTQRREPRWLPACRSLQPRPSAKTQAWLEDRGSLTRRLQQTCGLGFRVRLLHLDQARPLRSEADWLGCRPDRLALTREVSLECCDKPWVFARTLINSLDGPALQLKHLGNRPLGALLFADPSAKRVGMTFARLRPGHHLYESAATICSQRPEQFWARRTLFRFADKPLVISEIFLTELP